MSEPLIEKLRAQRNNGLAGALCGVAADRIAALEGELSWMADQKARIAEMESGDFMASWSMLQKFADRARALLSKRVTSDTEHQEILDEMQSDEHLPGWVTGKTP